MTNNRTDWKTVESIRHTNFVTQLKTKDLLPFLVYAVRCFDCFSTLSRREWKINGNFNSMILCK